MKMDDLESQAEFPLPLRQVDATHVMVGRRKLTYFGGCDYLRMSWDERVRKSLTDDVARDGLTVSASRKTTGNHEVYEHLEHQLRSFFNVRGALLVPTGYTANLILAQGLKGEISHVLIDQRAHPSLWDASQLLGAAVEPFAHRSPAAALAIIEKLPRTAKLALMTDGMFAAVGTIAPLAEYKRLLPKSALLWVDDAHGAGVLGQNGRGTLEHQDVARDEVIQTITLSKAFGLYGGAILGDRKMISNCIRKSRMLAGSTPLPLPLAAAAAASVSKLLNEAPRLELAENIRYFREKFPNVCRQMAPASPVMTVNPKDVKEKNQISKRLLAAGVFPSFLQYPGGPATGFFRFAFSSAHSREQIEALGKALMLPE